MYPFPSDLLALARSLGSLQGVRPDVADGAGARLVPEARSASLSLVARLVADVTHDSGYRQSWREVPPDRLRRSERDVWKRNEGHIETVQAALTLLARVPDAPVHSLTLLAHVESGLGRSGVAPAWPTDPSMSGLSAGRPSSRTGRAATNLSDLTAQKKPARVNFELEPDKHRRFKAVAARRGVTIKQLLTQYVDEVLDQEDRSRNNSYE